jgi:hypothetical protein
MSGGDVLSVSFLYTNRTVPPRATKIISTFQTSFALARNLHRRIDQASFKRTGTSLMSKRLLIAVAVATLTTFSASYAQTTITGSYTGTATETSGTPNYAPSVSLLGEQLGSPFSESLTVGTPTAEETFLSVAPKSGNTNVGTVMGSMSLALTFTAPSNSAVTGVSISSTTPHGDTATLSGGVVTVKANYELFYGTSPQSDCLTWNATTCSATGNQTTIGDTLVVTFADNAVLDVNLYNWSDWNMTPGISFTLVSGPSQTGHQPVPEPMSIALLGAALAGLGLIKHRRKSVKISDTH